MTCLECELSLADGVRTAETSAHLAQCPECRALAEDLAVNADVLRRMREEVVPARPLSVLRANRWLWAGTAAAAVLIVAFGVSQLESGNSRARVTPAVEPASPPLVELPPSPKSGTGPRPAAASRAASQRILDPALASPAESRPHASEPAEPLLVKMLTPDPDVVIYWLIESKEGLL
jgi:hypothetical protein